MHILEDHCILWLNWYHIGAGLMGEQGAESIYAHINKMEKTYSSFPNEQYRKYKLCPVSGCRAKPKKKLSYHIILYHPKITPKKRRSLCKNARIVNKKFVKPLKAPQKLLLVGMVEKVRGVNQRVYRDRKR